MTDTRAAEVLRFAEDATGQLRGMAAPEWRARLEARYSECSWALGWFLDNGRPDEALRLATALVLFWQYTDRISEGRDGLERALNARLTPDGARAEALFDAGLLAFWQGDDDAAEAFHRRSLELALEVGDHDVTALALTGLARITLRTDTHRAHAQSLEALAEVGETGESRGLASALHVLGVTAQMSGEFAEAREWMTKRLALARRMDDVRSVAAECANLSVVERELGHLAEARELALESLRLCSHLQDAWMIPYCLNSLAATYIATADADTADADTADADRADHEHAATLLSVADRLVTEQGATWPPDEAPHYHRSRAAAEQALSPIAYDRAWARGRAMPVEEAVAFALSRD